MDLKTYIDLSSSDEQWFCDRINCASPFKFLGSFFEPASSADLNPGTSISSANENGITTAFSPTRHKNTHPSNDCIKCLSLNVCSIRNKINNLQTLLLMEDFDIIALTNLMIGNSNSMDTTFFDVTDVIATAAFF